MWLLFSSWVMIRLRKRNVHIPAQCVRTATGSTHLTNKTECAWEDPRLWRMTRLPPLMPGCGLRWMEENFLSAGDRTWPIGSRYNQRNRCVCLYVYLFCVVYSMTFRAWGGYFICLDWPVLVSWRYQSFTALWWDSTAESKARVVPMV